MNRNRAIIGGPNLRSVNRSFQKEIVFSWLREIISDEHFIRLLNTESL